MLLEASRFRSTPRCSRPLTAGRFRPGAGNLGLMFAPAGTGGYDDLRRDATREQVAGIVVLVASLRDVIRSKEAAGREKDVMQLPILRRTLELLRRQER